MCYFERVPKQHVVAYISWIPVSSCTGLHGAYFKDNTVHRNILHFHLVWDQSNKESKKKKRIRLNVKEPPHLACRFIIISEKYTDNCI